MWQSWVYKNGLGIKEACSHLDHSCFTPQAWRARRWLPASGLGLEIPRDLAVWRDKNPTHYSKNLGAGRADGGGTKGVSSPGGAGSRRWRQIANMAPERLRSRAVSAFKLRGLLLRGWVARQSVPPQCPGRAETLRLFPCKRRGRPGAWEAAEPPRVSATLAPGANVTSRLGGAAPPGPHWAREDARFEVLRSPEAPAPAGCKSLQCYFGKLQRDTSKERDLGKSVCVSGGDLCCRLWASRPPVSVLDSHYCLEN